MIVSILIHKHEFIGIQDYQAKCSQRCLVRFIRIIFDRGVISFYLPLLLGEEIQRGFSFLGSRQTA
jgi:hypothetical protein